MKCAKFEYVKNNSHSNRKEKKIQNNKETYPSCFSNSRLKKIIQRSKQKQRSEEKKDQLQEEKIELALYFGITTFRAKEHTEQCLPVLRRQFDP